MKKVILILMIVTTFVGCSKKDNANDAESKPIKNFTIEILKSTEKGKFEHNEPYSFTAYFFKNGAISHRASNINIGKSILSVPDIQFDGVLISSEEFQYSGGDVETEFLSSLPELNSRMVSYFYRKLQNQNEVTSNLFAPYALIVTDASVSLETPLFKMGTRQYGYIKRKSISTWNHTLIYTVDNKKHMVAIGLAPGMENYLFLSFSNLLVGERVRYSY
ncbi:hypothetical protein MUK51_18415 [Sphingobacterium faecium]|uniref:hypothetical protein n=1 Tax=Sphingobacterium faecium TaxID=34087 RepID=UPI0021B5B30D|nr:hypothetical protein [Sphingobacterium faecium]UXD69154.1 hypothetical protein MUK51_18415 [Sphingobacterium faecium]